MPEPFARAKRTESGMHTIREAKKKQDILSSALQSISDKQGWFGSSLLSGLAGLGGKGLGTLIAGSGGGILPLLLAGAAVYATTKGLKSGRWGGKVGKAMSKAKKLSKGRFSETAGLEEAFDTYKTGIDKSAGIQALIDSVITMSTMGLGDAFKGLGKTGQAVGQSVDKYGNPVGEILSGVGKVVEKIPKGSAGDLLSSFIGDIGQESATKANPFISSLLQETTVKPFAKGEGIRNLLSQILKDPNFHTFAAPAMSKPAAMYAGLANLGKPAYPAYGDYRSLNVGGY